MLAIPETEGTLKLQAQGNESQAQIIRVGTARFLTRSRPERFFWSARQLGDEPTIFLFYPPRPPGANTDSIRTCQSSMANMS